ncbi:L,D-transpeptidase [Embleya hyalina]|uniref:Lipoprotein n=1 Tax=Embleya hyalina TaxID=516124 RepID=A0A401YP23_9ACTN|nr:Ig-like domain-containing protein [Embleya hyalina]GCD96289.1 lipoprotein [Embleya hyalina]
MPRIHGASRTGAAGGGIRLFAGLMVAPLIFIAGCSSDGGKTEPGGSGGTSGGTGGGTNKKVAAGPATIAITPADGTKSVETDGVLKVDATGGKLTSVVVTDAKGKTVDGQISPDGIGWKPAAPLANGGAYTVAAKAANADGAEVTAQSKFNTKSADDTFVADFNVEPDSTWGVGAIISLKFNAPIKDKAAIERNLKVVSEPAVQGSWSWLKDLDGNDRIDYRPEKYWASGTKVNLKANLTGAKAAPGVYGKQTKDIKFTIGRSLVATADLKSKHMSVKKDGAEVEDLPISAGGPNYPTWGGTMVVLDKVDGITMDSETVGLGDAYNMKNVRHAVHLTASGTYAHGAPWNDGKFGRQNDSHGCIGLSASNAKTFFDLVTQGDPVEVVNSTDKTVKAGNGLGGWSVDWATWVKGSALGGGGSTAPPAAPAA